MLEYLRLGQLIQHGVWMGGRALRCLCLTKGNGREELLGGYVLNRTIASLY